MQIERFINTPVASNTYVVSDVQSNEAIIIDPGSKDSAELVNYLHQQGLSLSRIFLTHDHFDHVWGVNSLLASCPAEIVCSQRCAERLSVPQKYFNLLYYGDATPYSVTEIGTALSGDAVIRMWNKDIQIFQTPGHSDSSICILMDDCLFSGDTLLKGFPPVFLKGCGSSKEAFCDSLKKLFTLPPETIVYPGHGNTFRLREGEEWIRSLYKDF